MTKADFDYGEVYLEKGRKKVQKEAADFADKGGEIKAMCNSLLSEGTKEAIEKLIFLSFQHDVGSCVIKTTNWGRIVGLALQLYGAEENPNNAIIVKVRNLDQLLYIMRTMRFLYYRYQLAEDEEAAASLEALFNEFGTCSKVRRMIKDAAKVPFEPVRGEVPYE